MNKRPAGFAPGFTLIELMIALVVIGILAAVAYPSYQDSLRKSRRSDALNTLGAAQLAQEKWRANHTTYATLDNLLDLGSIDGTSPEGYYTITIQQDITNETTCAADANDPSGTAYAILASAVTGTSQASDTGCTIICADQNGMYPDTCIRR